MFRRLRISAPRALVWFLATICYWALIFFAWWETRFRVFLGAEIFTELASRKALSAILRNLEVLEKDAWIAIADSVRLPMIFLLVPLVMAAVMFLAPFFVRRDYRGAVKGAFMLPVTTILCYIFASLMNLVIAASVTLGLYVYLQIRPGPDFFMYLVHPLYLLAPPAMNSLPGLLSQCVYLLFITSVLTTPGRRRWVPAADEADEARYAGDGEAKGPEDAPAKEQVLDSNYRACILETDRLCRIIDMRTSQPSLAHSVRTAIVDYIDVPGNVASAIEKGSSPYRIVLLEAAKSLRKTIGENPDRPGAKDAFLYVAIEMGHMEYCSPEECAAMREWLEKQGGTTATEQPQTAEKPGREKSGQHETGPAAKVPSVGSDHLKPKE